eukprot:11171069-Lingulodinium_polyedra.AAC.1
MRAKSTRPRLYARHVGIHRARGGRQVIWSPLDVAGIKYADIPNGCGAISNVPGFARWKSLAFALCCEASSN